MEWKLRVNSMKVVVLSFAMLLLPPRRTSNVSVECHLESAKLFSGGSSHLPQLHLGHAPMTDSPCVFLKLDRTPEAKPLALSPKLPARVQKHPEDHLLRPLVST